MMRFEDIPQFISCGNYEVDIPWTSLERTIADLQTDYALNLDPDFQRGHVWTKAKQIAYVEFVLHGGRSSRTLLFNCPNFHTYGGAEPMVIVDGKQRLEAVQRFMAGKIPAFGHKISEYTDKLHVMHNTIRFQVNDLATRAEVLTWYLQLNAGGVVHTEAELNRVRTMLEAEVPSDTR